MHSFEKYVIIKIKNHKILVLMSIRSPKLDKIDASYPGTYITQSCKTFMYFFVFISLIYHIIMHFFEQYVEIKIEDHKILILTSEPSRNQDKRYARNLYKYKWIIS